ncbi:hypothetical protein [uncultured Ruminococcus sp.]|uniref:hypothetical protein n=1 Tax=uncultured Ruminococcus sp. TaxID=165186 RepID=UPI000EEBC052|nr:hypothetical protein [uncultured Ruminococcus sp.]HCJ41002.1 hypothetical protein [Ruminococcus sp.]
MSRFTRFKLCAAASLILTVAADHGFFDDCLKKNTFLPSQAIQLDCDESDEDTGIIVMSPKGRIRISFKIEEIFRKLF